MVNKSIIWFALALILLIGAIIYGRQSQTRSDDFLPEKQTMDKSNSEPVLVEITTNLGKIVMELWPDKAPQTVENFLKLSRQGFYTGTLFHRVIPDFMIQGGDPLSKQADRSLHGTGGPGYQFADEINDEKLVAGTVAMANAGPNTNGSQFFIVTADSTPWLDGLHTVFGRVSEGLAVVEKISQVARDANDHPLEDVRIEQITISQ